jgi:hypothetical protein
VIIALDYDGTYDLAPELWDEFITSAHARGHRVVMVTCRRDTEENRADMKVPGLLWSEHYFTNLASKRWHMHQLGVNVDVWIDDLPECVKDGR